MLALCLMDDTHCIPYRSTGYFSKLICDYLDQKPELQHLYHRFPSLENFEDQIEEKSGFERANRELLQRQLQQQYQGFEITEALQNNLENLANSKTFTITTGHQLNLFTGPLYFFYKIVSVINLCKRLKQQYPDYDFVPVYWMATEDHDFAEINHINRDGGRLVWDREASGPVGRLKTDSLAPVLDRLEELSGPGTRTKHLLKILRTAYLQQANLAQATRYLVHHFFAHEGLVIVDGDDVELKKVMIPYFEKDLLENLSSAAVKTTTDWLSDNYFEQVHARDINLFYIKEGLRERIESDGKVWQVLNTDIRWNRSELLEELQNHPERFSPNVILRPLYQEVILPNLAYIGGGGELAYWLQLKTLFNKVAVPFPMLILRNSALLYTNRQEQKLSKLGLEIQDLFQPLHQIKGKLAAETAPVNPALEPYQSKLQKMFDELEEVAHLTDKSMLGAVNAQRQKQLNGLDKLRKKLIRAEKRKHSDTMQRLEDLYLQLFPGGGLQERHDNFIQYYEEYGEAWLEKLMQSLNPLDFRFTLIRQK